jgi:hypothetical protein
MTTATFTTLDSSSRSTIAVRRAKRRRRVPMAMDEDLQCALLRQLLELERTFRSGDVVVVQPAVDGMRMTNPVGLPGYDDRVVEAHLRALLVERLIENGGMPHPNVGIHFARLTRRGRKWLAARAQALRAPPSASSKEK